MGIDDFLWSAFIKSGDIKYYLAYKNLERCEGCNDNTSNKIVGETLQSFLFR